MPYEIPRRIDLLRFTPAELAIRNAVFAVEQLRNLLDLKKGWDSYHAKEISLYAVEQAEKFIAALHIVPTVNGGVQLEWHRQGVDIEIEFAADGKLVSCSITRATP